MKAIGTIKMVTSFENKIKTVLSKFLCSYPFVLFLGPETRPENGPGFVFEVVIGTIWHLLLLCDQKTDI